MDGFGDNFDQADVDPAAEFLAREKDQLAGLEDDLEPTGADNDENNPSNGSSASAGKWQMHRTSVDTNRTSKWGAKTFD